MNMKVDGGHPSNFTEGRKPMKPKICIGELKVYFVKL